jgi:hypothetical protein
MKLKCVEIKLPLYNFLSPKSYQSVVVDVADMFLGIAVHHSFQSPPERLVTKNTRRTTVCQKHVLAFWDNFNHAIMILLNWRYAILTHMSVTVVAPTCQ